MNGYERRKHKKMEQIYAVAFQLFSRHGYQKVSVNEIAQQQACHLQRYITILEPKISSIWI